MKQVLQELSLSNVSISAELTKMVATHPNTSGAPKKKKALCDAKKQKSMKNFFPAATKKP